MKNTLYLVKISDDVQQLTGEGFEILTDKQGEPIAHFIDGKMPRQVAINIDEPTVKAA